MAGDSIIKLTIGFNDPELDNEDLETHAQNLLKQLKEMDEVESVGRVLDPNPPEGTG